MIKLSDISRVLIVQNWFRRNFGRKRAKIGSALETRLGKFNRDSAGPETILLGTKMAR